MVPFIIQAAFFVQEAYIWLLIFNIFMSWFSGLQDMRIGQWIQRLTEPYLQIFRRMIPSVGGLDLSPILAIFAFRFLAPLVILGLENVLTAIF